MTKRTTYVMAWPGVSWAQLGWAPGQIYKLIVQLERLSGFQIPLEMKCESKWEWK